MNACERPSTKPIHPAQIALAVPSHTQPRTDAVLTSRNYSRTFVQFYSRIVSIAYSGVLPDVLVYWRTYTTRTFTIRYL